MHSKETRLKISNANKGRKLTDEQYKKMIEGQRKIKVRKKQSIESRNKRSLRLRGDKSHFWKGGITNINLLERTRVEYKLWRKSVLERDNYTCQKTKQHGGELVAHHINNFSDNINLRFAIDNGVTLSKKAHKEFHKLYGIKNNTLEQIIEFINSN